MAYDQDDGTAAIYREPMPPQKSCTSYRVWKILSIIYAIIFFVSILLLSAIVCLFLPRDATLYRARLWDCTSNVTQCQWKIYI